MRFALQPGHATGIKEIRRIDDHTVDMRLDAPNIIDFRIMSKGWAEKNKTRSTQGQQAKEDKDASRNVTGNREALFIPLHQQMRP